VSLQYVDSHYGLFDKEKSMSDELGLALFSEKEDVVGVPLYYQIKKNKHGISRIVILDNNKAEELMSKNDNEADVKVLNTKWRQARWGDQNTLVKQCQKINAATGATEVDWTKFRDMRIKQLLVDWDITMHGKKVDVTVDAIDKLPAELVLGLYERYDAATSFDEAEMEK